MIEKSILGTLLLLFTGMFTYKGFVDQKYFDRYKFDVDEILIGGQYDRLLSSGFLHANWLHFGFNMIALLAFSLSLEDTLGIGYFAIIYFASLIGGSLLALYIHRQHGDYTAVGASGAVSGVIFATIILYPDSSISFIIIPIEIKSWIFGILFVLVSILGIKSQADNIGHEAHLGGALIGILLTLLIEPSVIVQHWWVILLLALPVLTFLGLLIRNPEMLLVDKYWGSEVESLKTMKPFVTKKKTMDELLDKIAHKGVDSLTKQEKKWLDEYREEM